jgi:hypothetical protein
MLSVRRFPSGLHHERHLAGTDTTVPGKALIDLSPMKPKACAVSASTTKP